MKKIFLILWIVLWITTSVNGADTHRLASFCHRVTQVFSLGFVRAGMLFPDRRHSNERLESVKASISLPTRIEIKGRVFNLTKETSTELETWLVEFQRTIDQCGFERRKKANEMGKALWEFSSVHVEPLPLDQKRTIYREFGRLIHKQERMRLIQWSFPILQFRRKGLPIEDAWKSEEMLNLSYNSRRSLSVLGLDFSNPIEFRQSFQKLRFPTSVVPHDFRHIVWASYNPQATSVFIESAYSKNHARYLLMTALWEGVDGVYHKFQRRFNNVAFNGEKVDLALLKLSFLPVEYVASNEVLVNGDKFNLNFNREYLWHRLTYWIPFKKPLNSYTALEESLANFESLYWESGRRKLQLRRNEEEYDGQVMQ